MSPRHQGKSISSVSAAMGEVNKSASNATTKPRFRSRTGCWTCRRRKVKCDERGRTTEAVAYAGQLEPHLGCKRCEDSGRPCLGYGAAQPPRHISVSPYHQQGYAMASGTLSVQYGVQKQAVSTYNAGLDSHPAGSLASSSFPSPNQNYPSHGTEQSYGQPLHSWPTSYPHPMTNVGSQPYASPPDGSVALERRNSLPTYGMWPSPNAQTGFGAPGYMRSTASSQPQGPMSQTDSPTSSTTSGQGGSLHSHTENFAYDPRPHSAEDAYSPESSVAQQSYSASGGLHSPRGYVPQNASICWDLGRQTTSLGYVSTGMGRTPSVPVIRSAPGHMISRGSPSATYVQESPTYEGRSNPMDHISGMVADTYDLHTMSLPTLSRARFHSPTMSEEGAMVVSSGAAMCSEGAYSRYQDFPAHAPPNSAYNYITNDTRSSSSSQPGSAWLLTEPSGSPSTGTGPHSPR